MALWAGRLTGAAAALPPGRWIALAVGFAGLAGVLLGWASIPDPAPSRDRLVAMAGTLAGVLVLTLYLAGVLYLLRERFDHPVMRIAPRVAAAWIMAIAVLMLALGLALAPG